MFDEEIKLDNKNNILMKTKKEFNKLIKEAKELKDMNKLEQIDIDKNKNYLDLLKSNIDFIENEYKDSINLMEYTQALNILNNNIENLKTRLDGFNA